MCVCVGGGGGAWRGVCVCVYPNNHLLVQAIFSVYQNESGVPSLYRQGPVLVQPGCCSVHHHRLYTVSLQAHQCPVCGISGEREDSSGAPHTTILLRSALQYTSTTI